jgi:hypothetical protein
VRLKYTLNAALFALIDAMVSTGVLKVSVQLVKAHFNKDNVPRVSSTQRVF